MTEMTRVVRILVGRRFFTLITSLSTQSFGKVTDLICYIFVRLSEILDLLLVVHDYANNLLLTLES